MYRKHHLQPNELLDFELWSIYQHCYFQGIRRHQPWHAVTRGQSGAIISVWNPMGKRYSLSQNRRMERAIRHYLRATNCDFWPVWGGSESMEYRELSFFIPCSRKQAQQLAQRFSQLAYYYLNREGKVWLYCSQQSMPITRLEDSMPKRWLNCHLPINNQALLARSRG